ncbi:hypothetical protein LI328DRAFT_126499 [Trichoderma asperelloides]|nr:hypothetical protein LI328DRAFT_126499 [Trichoderma asperelloides]
MKSSIILCLLPAALAVPVAPSPLSIGYNPFIGGYNYNCWSKYYSCIADKGSGNCENKCSCRGIFFCDPETGPYHMQK